MDEAVEAAARAWYETAWAHGAPWQALPEPMRDACRATVTPIVVAALNAATAAPGSPVAAVECPKAS